MGDKYVLNYFNFTGRAEPARLMFILTGTEYKDNQIAFTAMSPLGGQAWWDLKKANSKFARGSGRNWFRLCYFVWEIWIFFEI